jgi:hypothetical protein
MNFKFEFDNGMKATIALSDTAPAGAGGGAETVSFYPSGSSQDAACSEPPDSPWDYYPIRLVKSGRYYHHWYALDVGCNSEDDDTRLELKVTPDW